MEINYDAHVKTHQRHILIQWLEAAKSEKIKKLQEEKLSILQQKIDVPRVDVSENKLNYNNQIPSKVFNVYSASDIVLQTNKIQFSDPEINIDDISSSLIPSDNIEISESVNNFVINIDENAMGNIVSEKIAFPKDIKEFDYVIDRDIFNDINQPDIELPHGISGFETKISDKTFKDIKLEKIESGDMLNELTATFEAFGADVLPKFSADMYSDIKDYKNELDQKKFEGIFSEPELPENNQDLTISIDAAKIKIDIVDINDIPDGIKNYNYTLNDKIFDNIVTNDIELAEEKIEFIPEIKSALFENVNPESVELPDKVYIEPAADMKTAFADISKTFENVDAVTELNIDEKPIMSELLKDIPNSSTIAGDIGIISEINLSDVRLSDNNVNIQNEPIAVPDNNISLELGITFEKFADIVLPEVSITDSVKDISEVSVDTSRVGEIKFNNEITFPDFSDIIQVMQAEKNNIHA